MSLQRFDTLILGDDLAGLIAGNLLSHFRHKVLVLRNSIPVDKYMHNHYVLPVSPVLLPPLKFGELMSQIRQFFSLSQAEFEEDALIIDRFQYITKRLRLDISVDSKETVEELFCEIGIEKERTGRFIESTVKLREELIEWFNQHYPYPPYSFWDKRKLKGNIFEKLDKHKSIFNHFEKEREKNIFRTFLAFIQNVDVSSNIFSQDALPGMFFFEPWLVLSSIERIKYLLIKRLEEQGALILQNHNNKYVVEKRGFGYYLRDDRHHSSFKIDSVILSSDPDYLSKNLSTKIFNKLNLNLGKYKVRYTTNFIVSSKCLPEVASNLIFFNENPETAEPLELFQISVSKAMKGKAIIKENLVISITTFIDPPYFHKKFSEKLNQKAKEVLLRVFPFADKFIYDISSVLESDTLLDVNMNEIKKSNYTSNQFLFTGCELQNGILLNDMKTNIDNFINSFYVFPSMGILGEFMAAVRAAEIISKNIVGK